MNQLHLLICILIVFSSLFVVISNNPVESVLYLVLTFCNAAIILFLFNLEFFALIFLIIYVGAIAVLFLFIVMMIQIKEQPQSSILNYKKELAVYAIICLVLYIIIVEAYVLMAHSVPLSTESIFIDGYSFATNSFNNFSVDQLTGIENFGQVLYNYFLIFVPVAGFLLLIALIGSIALTLEFTRSKEHTSSFKQLSRTDQFLSFFSKILKKKE